MAAKYEEVAEILQELLNLKNSETPDFKRVFQKMIDHPYKGKVMFSHISKMSPEDFTEDNLGRNYIRWFRNYPDKFAVFEGDDGRIAMFGIRDKNARLCLNKDATEGKACVNDPCKKFHVCQKFIGGDCSAGSQCCMDHHFQSDHSSELLRRYDLDKYNDNDLITIFRQSQLQICDFYDRKGSCDFEDRCTRIHICSDFVQGTCTEPCAKKLKHNFDSLHSQRLLKIYDLHDRPMADVLSQLLFVYYHRQRKQDHARKKEEILNTLFELFRNVGQTEGNEAEDRQELAAEASKITTENADKMKSTLSKTDSCSSPSLITHEKKERRKALYQWQLEIFGQWVALDRIRNKKIEEAFCNPDKETIDVSLPDVEDCCLDDTMITVDFTTMTSILQEGQDYRLQLRRNPSPDDSWLWYFQMDDETWAPYSEDGQVVLENGFLIKEKRVFVGKMELYRVKLSNFTQKNRETGKERKVRRRPIFIEA